MAAPKQTLGEKLFHQGEPYHFQRFRHRLGEYPRPPQPNTYQPNRNFRIKATRTREYFQKAFEDYLDRRRTLSKYTGLSLGRI